MTKYKSIRNGICATIMAVTPILLSAQIVKHDRLLSFESAEVPSFISGTNSGLSISDQHYKDGTHSLQWKFQPELRFGAGNSCFQISRKRAARRRAEEGRDCRFRRVLFHFAEGLGLLYRRARV